MWYKEDFSHDSDKLIIFFTSYFKGVQQEDKFEWINISKDVGKIYSFNRLYIKDLNFAWWQTSFEGIDGYGPHVLAEFLKKEVSKSNCKKVMTIGASMAGYGAILFSCLCKFDLAIGISPQTYLGKHRYKKYNLNEKFKEYNINKEELDLKVILDRYNNNFTKYLIYFGKYSVADSENANRISKFKNVFLHEIDSDKHSGIGKIMYNLGIIKNIFSDFINGD